MGCAVLVLVAYELLAFGPRLESWDPLFVTGVLTLLVGLKWGLTLSDRFREMLIRLEKRGALKLGQGFDGFLIDLETRAESLSQVVGSLSAVCLLIAFIVVYGFDVRTRLFVLAVAILGGYVAGRVIGRAVAYGTLGSLLKARGKLPEAQPAHLDGAAGLRPLGEFFFYQAMIVALPAVFLAGWWIAIPLIHRYSYWRNPYLALLVLCVIAEALAFIAPMVSFHQAMRLSKRERLLEADALSHEVDELQARLILAQTDQERASIKEELGPKVDRYQAVETMPTWPVDRRTRRRFTLNNALLITPLVMKALSVSGPWNDIVDQLQRVVSQ
jgi:hypothetical protein